MKKLAIILSIVFLGSILFATIAKADEVINEPTPGFQTKLTSTYPCYAEYSPVTLVGRSLQENGTWSEWRYIRTIDRWSNPNYPCATQAVEPVKQPVAAPKVEKRRVVVHRRCAKVVKFQRSLDGQSWVTYRKVIKKHKCHC